MFFLLYYVSITVIFFYSFHRELKVVNLMSSDVKLRKKANERKNKISSDMKLVIVWPVLLIKEVYDEIKQRRQS